MNSNARLARLILDFYREDRDRLRSLAALRECRIRRRWRTLDIHCLNRTAADRLLEARELLAEPVALLKFAQQIRILVRGRPVATLPLGDRRDFLSLPG